MIPGTESVRAPEPFFSPDGRWVGFYANSRLQKVSVLGGAAITICEADLPVGASWGDNDQIVFGQGPGGVHRVNSAGGTPEVVVKVDAAQGEFALSPEVLPDGRTLLFTLRRGGSEQVQVVALSLDSGAQRTVVDGGRDSRYVPPGYLIYGRGDTLMAAAFDAERFEIEGAPVPAVTGIDTSVSSGLLPYDVSKEGTLVYRPIERTISSASWALRSGLIEELPMEPRNYRLPRISPDGNRVAAIVDRDIWIYDLSRELWSRLTSTADVSRLAWFPDGQSLIFSSARNGVDNLYRQAVHASGPATRLTVGTVDQHIDSVSPDGRTALFHEHRGGASDLWLLTIGEGLRSRPLVATEFHDRTGIFSPNGQWIAYTSNERGQSDIYIRAIDDSGGTMLAASGQGPVWSPDGRELFYVADGKLMAIDVRMESSVQFGEPRSVLATGYSLLIGPMPNYDIDPNGERFFVLSASGEQDRINVVVNWRTELAALVSGELRQ